MRRLGPGFVITAAFIGPGTITTATVSGANFGFALLWALVFSIATTLILQEMSLRLGLTTRLGLAEVLRQALPTWLKWPVLGLIVIAIGLGNAAYQTGNLLGAAVGAAIVTGWDQSLLAGVIALAATLLLATGVYRLVEGVLMFLVVIMSVVFVVAMAMSPPNWGAVVSGLVPRVPDASITTIIALIGTTVVPYNLFLHARIVQERWSSDADVDESLGEARWDLSISVLIGGLITLAIMSTAATVFFGTHVDVNGATIATQLEPLLGSAAKYFMATGLFAAGLTSAITAPLAAAYAVSGAFGWETNLRSWRFRSIWLTVIMFGAAFALFESRPIAAILVAQAANGLLLPLIAIALLWVMNAPALANYRNGPVTNGLGLAVILVMLLLGTNKLAALL